MAYAQGAQSRFDCTPPFSLHHVVLAYGVTAYFLSMVFIIASILPDNMHRPNAEANAEAVKYSVIWMLLTTVVACVSRLQGLVLVQPNGSCFNCHTILAVISLVNLGIIGASCPFDGRGVFSNIYIVHVLVFGLWMTVICTCCKARGPEVGPPGTELPIVNPAGQQQQEAVIAVPASVQHVVGIPAPSQIIHCGSEVAHSPELTEF